MTRVRVIALGSAHGGDDEAALTLARELAGARDHDHVEWILAGRPGPGLVDLLDVGPAIVLLDVVQSGAAPGTIIELPLGELPDHVRARGPLSSHGFGPAEALQLAAALGRERPRGRFLGVEAGAFELGAGLSPAVADALPRLRERVRAAIHELSSQDTPCTNPD